MPSSVANGSQSSRYFKWQIKRNVAFYFRVGLGDLHRADFPVKFPIDPFLSVSCEQLLSQHHLIVHIIVSVTSTAASISATTAASNYGPGVSLAAAEAAT